MLHAHIQESLQVIFLFAAISTLYKMNWMTSAKNRLQRSSKSKNNNTLRMNASSKLPYSRVKNSVVMHNFNATSKREEARHTRSSESSDIWMLNNLSRNRRLEEKVNQHSVSIVAEKKVERAIPFDPLQDLDMTPSKRLLNNDVVEEQQIVFYNDGHLCDELGNLLLSDSVATATQHTVGLIRKEARMHLFSPVSERTPPESRSGQQIGGSKNPEGGGKMESPDESLSSTNSDDWWHRLITMLAHSTMAENYLHTVLAEIVPVASVSTVPVAVPSATSGATSALLQTAEGLNPPTAREVLDALYRALSKVGRDQRSSLIVFDAIRMLEIVDKQQSEPYQQHYLNDNTTRANSTASSLRHTTANRTHMDRLNNINNTSLQSLVQSQDANGALDLDTLLGNNTADRNSDTNHIQQKENHYKPNYNAKSNASTKNTNPFDSTNKTNFNTSSRTKISIAPCDDNELDWNLFDAPCAATTVTTSHNSTNTAKHSINPAVPTVPAWTDNTGACTNSVFNTNHDDKSEGQKRKATDAAGKPRLSLYTHRTNRDDVELRLEDLF